MVHLTVLQWSLISIPALILLPGLLIWKILPGRHITTGGGTFPKLIVAWSTKRNCPTAAFILENGRWGDLAAQELADQGELRMLTPGEIATLVRRGEYDFITITDNQFTINWGLAHEQR